MICYIPFVSSQTQLKGRLYNLFEQAVFPTHLSPAIITLPWKSYSNIIYQSKLLKLITLIMIQLFFFTNFYISMIKRIAIYGGAFDPPHKGHIQIIKNLANLAEIDEVWLMPCGDREDKKLLLSMQKRFKLMRTIFKEIPQIKISDEEIQLSKTLKKAIHTYDLLNLLKDKYMNTKFYFVIGGDILHTIHTWGNAQKLVQENAFIFFNRKGFQFLQQKLPKDSKIIQVDLPDISSSAIKRTISDKTKSNQQKFLELKEWVSEEVLTLLQKEKLI